MLTMLNGMGGPVFNIVTLVVALGLAVMVHEMGHYIVARLSGIKVLRFSLGMPPKLFGVKIGETEYMISAIPLGGYVRLSGEDLENTGKMKPYDLMAKAWWIRCLVYVAGVTMNLLLAYLLFFMALAHGLDIDTYPAVLDRVPAKSMAAEAGLVAGDRITAVDGRAVEDYDDLAQALGRTGNGKTAALKVVRGGVAVNAVVKMKEGIDPGFDPRIEPVIGTVSAAQPARKAGIKPGDRILAIDGKAIAWWSDISPLISRAKPGPVRMRLLREGRTITIPVTPRQDSALHKPVIGISPKPMRVKVRRFTLYESAKYSGAEIGVIVSETVKTVWHVVIGRQKFRDAIGGPVMIARIGYEKAKSGIWDLIHFAGALNVMLLVANLLPIPVVDGGMIVLACLEGIRRRRFSAATYGILMNIGVAFLIGVFVLATYNDIVR